MSSVDDEGRPGPLRPYISRTLAAVDRAMAPTRTSSTDRGASPTGSPRRIVSSRRLSTSQTASVEAAVWSGTANRTNNAMTTWSRMVGASDEASSASDWWGAQVRNFGERFHRRSRPPPTRLSPKLHRLGRTRRGNRMGSNSAADDTSASGDLSGVLMAQPADHEALQPRGPRLGSGDGRPVQLRPLLAPPSAPNRVSAGAK